MEMVDGNLGEWLILEGKRGVWNKRGCVGAFSDTRIVYFFGKQFDTKDMMLTLELSGGYLKFSCIICNAFPFYY